MSAPSGRCSTGGPAAPLWLRLIALDGDLARAEPKTLRYRILHAAGKLVRGGRRRRLKISTTWPWADAIATAWARITALPQAP
jgi:hypothetical protein